MSRAASRRVSARFGSTRSARPLRARDLAARLPLLFAGRSAFDGGLGLHRRHAVGRDALEPLPLESRHFLLRNDRVNALGDKVLLELRGFKSRTRVVVFFTAASAPSATC